MPHRRRHKHIELDQGKLNRARRVLDIALEVNLKHEVYISPRVLGRAILADPVWSIAPFLQAIAKEGIPL